jgi:hypothetical protein
MTAILHISVCPFLAGQDRPIVSDGVLFVSPAMASLMDGTHVDDLALVIKNLHPIEIPGLFSLPEWPMPKLTWEETAA